MQAAIFRGAFDIQVEQILDFTVSLADVASGYRAMDQRQAIKALVQP